MDELKAACKKEEGNMRHCAFCSVSIPSEEVKVCGKCHKRAYCSRKCQAADWTPKDNIKQGKGQGHKTWCGLLCGEEDVDWEVASFEGKGQGLKAKRFIPANFRIMVDGFRTKDENIFLDVFKSSKSLGRSKLANHSCDGNSTRLPDEIFKVIILGSDRDIQEGEEITTNYLCYNMTLSAKVPEEFSQYGYEWLHTFEDSRRLLQAKWGIVCPSDCFCYNKKMDKEIEESKKMSACIMSEHDKKYSALEAAVNVEIVKRLLIKHKIIRSPLVDKGRILRIGFEAAIQHKNTMDLAKEFIREAVDIWSIYHPESEVLERHRTWMNDPASHPSYLKFNDQELQPSVNNNES